MDKDLQLPTATDVKVFVPAKDFKVSLAFYKALGWQENFVADDEEIAELELAGNRFYLQNHYNKVWAENFMLHLTVDDANAWYQHALKVVDENSDFSKVKIREPQEESYGALVTHILDPSGVLIHCAQFLS